MISILCATASACVLATRGTGPEGEGGGGAVPTSSSSSSSTSGSSSSSTSSSSTSSSSTSSSSTSSSSTSSSGGTSVFCSDTTLIGCFTFDTAAGFADESPAKNNPLFSGTKPPLAVGQSGSGAVFTGAATSDGYAYFSDVTGYQASAMSSATVELWIHPSGLPAAGARAGVFDAQGAFSLFLYASQTGQVANAIRCDSGVAAWSTTSIQAGKWTHVACVFSTLQNKAHVETYIDGVREGAVDGADSTSFKPGASDVFIGANATDGAEPLDATIDGLRVWNVARSPQEICAAVGKSTCP
jgi:hypothetical protein